MRRLVAILRALKPDFCPAMNPGQAGKGQAKNEEGGCPQKACEISRVDQEYLEDCYDQYSVCDPMEHMRANLKSGQKRS